MITVLDLANAVNPTYLRSKIVAIAVLFLSSLAAFVVQTETTALAYRLGFAEPLVLLLLTHGLWWLIWPVQLLALAAFHCYRATKPAPESQRLSLADDDHASASDSSTFTEFPRVLGDRFPSVSRTDAFRLSIVKQLHSVYHTAILIYEGHVHGDRLVSNLGALVDRNPHLDHSGSVAACLTSFSAAPAIRHVARYALYTVLVLTVAGLTWYGAMALTYAADVTAIYNCLAFMAYVFSVPLLHDQFLPVKAAAVLVAVAGVFVVAYAGTSADDRAHPHRFAGDILILAGAVLYGLYEVMYKMWLCVPAHLGLCLTARRQLAFATFVMSLFGIYTALILLLAALFGHLLGVHSFNLWHYGPDTGRIWVLIAWLCASNLAFSACFLSLMALTSPVLSSVSSLLTIFLVGLVEWILFGTTLGPLQLLGDVLVVVGFLVLTIASWREIAQGLETDDVEAISALSFAGS